MRSLFKSMYLYVCKACSLKAELAKRIQMLPQVTERIILVGGSRQQYEMTRRTPNRSQETEIELIWLHLKVFRLSKDDSSATWKGKRRSRQKKSWEDIIIKNKRWTGKDCASINMAPENRSR